MKNEIFLERRSSFLRLRRKRMEVAIKEASHVRKNSSNWTIFLFLRVSFFQSSNLALKYPMRDFIFLFSIVSPSQGDCNFPIIFESFLSTIGQHWLRCCSSARKILLRHSLPYVKQWITHKNRKAKNCSLCAEREIS